MGEFIRTFIAIDPDDKSTERLMDFSNKLKMNIKGDIKWTKRENLHFTLKFLGEAPSEMVERSIDTLDTIAKHYKRFRVSIGGVGFFPDVKRPRILWVGAREGREEMESLANLIENKFENIGFSRESREFKAHLTLARIKSPFIKIDQKAIEEVSKETLCQFEVNSIILYRSDLFPSGPRYTAIRVFDLQRV